MTPVLDLLLICLAIAAVLAGLLGIMVLLFWVKLVRSLDDDYERIKRNGHVDDDEDNDFSV